MKFQQSRRNMLKNSAFLLAASPSLLNTEITKANATPLPYKIKLSCNLYSFNQTLSANQQTLEEVFEFCARLGFDAVDPTGYYFPGYPEKPEMRYINKIKQKAFLLGLDISGTGVRNDFTLDNTKKLQAEIQRVKNWIEVSASLGAPVLRVFAGKPLSQNQDRARVTNQVVDCISECVEYGKANGVMVVLQNHNEFLTTVDQILEIRNKIASDWFGLNVDIGSLRTGDPYEQIEKLAPYAYTWQIKELVYQNQVPLKTDVRKVIEILKKSGYRGYIPIETLGEGDPQTKIFSFYLQVSQAMT